MRDPLPLTDQPRVARRHVARGAAWAVPSLAVAASAPAVAASCSPEPFTSSLTLGSTQAESPNWVASAPSNIGAGGFTWAAASAWTPGVGCRPAGTCVAGASTIPSNTVRYVGDPSSAGAVATLTSAATFTTTQVKNLRFTLTYSHTGCQGRTQYFRIRLFNTVTSTYVASSPSPLISAYGYMDPLWPGTATAVASNVTAAATFANLPVGTYRVVYEWFYNDITPSGFCSSIACVCDVQSTDIGVTAPTVTCF